jgi:rhamnosyl/mannosyltransferase
LKILHIGKYYAPYTGGMESVVKALCEGQIETGHQVDVLCFNDNNKSTYELYNGVGVHRMGILGVIAGQPIALGMYSKLKSIVNDYDLIHVHSPNPLAELLCLTIPKEIPIVSTHHSDIVRQKFLTKYYYPLYEKFLMRVGKIHVPTENHIEYSACLPKFSSKCEIIPFGIRVEHLHKNDIAEEIKSLKTKYEKYALFVGRLVGYKGIDVLIKAAKTNKYPVLIVGDGPLREKLEKMVFEYNLQDSVHILGKVLDDKEFRALYHGCEFLVLPSVTPNENFGMTQLEAMSCGKPVITTNLKSGVPAVGVRGKTTLITEPGNVTQLAGAMTMLMENPELQVTMGKSAYEHFMNKYQWKTMIASTNDSYERLTCFSDIISKYSDTKKAA